MVQKYRISTNIGEEQKVIVELKQDFNLLEILSLKFTQQEAYTSLCSDYGVVCGRISVNNGFGVPNAKVSIFVPQKEIHVNDPVISKLYPYTSVSDKDESNYRYNLLPARKQHGGHEPTGTFPDQEDILTREEILEVYENYYSYTVKTNSSGDFMIWGVPLGQQIIHVDVDLSDTGCFSLRPYDFIRQGEGVDKFKNTYSFKSSEDLDSLPQIVSFSEEITVYPFWGNEDFCEIGITRKDFDLSDRGVKIQPKAYLIGGIYTDNNKNAINKNCIPRAKMGRKCDLVTKSAKVEAIRFSNSKDVNLRPNLEFLEFDEDIPDDGGFVIPLEMNMDYVYTNEFGENEITNDPNKGIPTSACYRLRFNLNDNGLERVRTNADFLIPNIREYQTEVDKSYYFGTEWSGYPTNAVSTNSDYGILYNEEGYYYPRDYFYRFTYNKVYTVSSLQSSYVKTNAFGKNQFLGIKELVPTEEEDCSENLTPPVNFGVKNYTFTLLIGDFLLTLDYIIKWITLQTLNFLIKDVLDPLAEGLISIGIFGLGSLGRDLRRWLSNFQINNTTKLSIINYPECEECSTEDIVVGGGGDTNPLVNCIVGTFLITGSTNSANRYIPISTGTFSTYTGYTSPTCSGATFLSTFNDLYTDQVTNFIESDGIEIILDDVNPGYPFILYSGGTYYLYDIDLIFSRNRQYSVNIRQVGQYEDSSTLTGNDIETGCQIYDTLYDESLATGYFVTSGLSRTYVPTLSPGMDVQSTLISGEGTGVAGTNPFGPPLNGLSQCRDMESEVHSQFNVTPSKRSEFANGVFYIVPGTQSSARLSGILREYYRRKRVGKLFCGGIVNYSFIDNWLSGSLYFFQFKSKKVSGGVESNMKYCRNLVRFVETQKRFYYRSAFTLSGSTFNRLNNILGFPTTFVDLGPRDEFIKEICVDKNLDPNCAVARSIGSTSFKSFGELLGLAINYRMDVSNSTFEINNFFDNSGFSGQSFQNVLDGDILQLVSINNEVGIEEFDLQNPKYIGYSYQILDPDLYPNFFKKNNDWGPLPVTMELDEDGQRIRSCLNEPGRLTESSQKIPFYLWNKRGTGFGTSGSLVDDQSWDYSSIQIQPLQGMTYGYTATGSYSDTSDPYLLLPITNNFSGLTISGLSVSETPEFDIIYSGSSTAYQSYNSQYPGFTVLRVTSGTLLNPTSGTLHIRVGNAGNDGIVGWQIFSWNNGMDFILPQREDYYGSNTKQILSTPFQFYFGLKAGKTGLDKFIDLYGPKGAFTSAE
jgi:hypothetical protein